MRLRFPSLALEVLCLSALVTLGGACSRGGKAAAPAVCNTGDERCPCYGNLTCNGSLVCLSDRCVSLPGDAGIDAAGAGGGVVVPGTGGANAGTGGAATGTGGATAGTGGANAGTGGAAPGTGGATAGTGGANAGSGGANAGTGGAAPGTGGAPSGSGGATGSGGSTPGSGGATSGSGGAAPGGNLIKNGDFGQGTQYWNLNLTSGGPPMLFTDTGEYCVFNTSSTSYLSFSLGYPTDPVDAFAVEPGATYTLSYRANAVGASIGVKIGGAAPPYTEIYTATDTPSLVGYQTYARSISSAAGETVAGLVFNVTLNYYSDVCFDDVQLIKQ